MSPRTRLARHFALASFAVLVAALTLETFGIDRLQMLTRAVLWTVWVLPLLLFLPGLLRGSWKSHLWLCFVVMVYFMMAISELFDPRHGAADWLELVAIVVLFVASMMFSRWRQRELAGGVDGRGIDG
jgi:uncharacterized membrane protein